MVKATGDIITVAGNGIDGYRGDNGPATAAELDEPLRVVVDSAGDLFIADDGNNVVREVTTAVTVTIGPAVASQVAITSPALSLIAGSPGQVTVQLEDINGNPSTSSSAQTISLSTTSTAGAFYATQVSTTPITSVVIPAGDSSANFYYSDTKAGLPTVKASDSALSSAPTQVETVNPAAAQTFTVTTSFANPDAAGTAGTVTVTAKDHYGNTVGSGPSQYEGTVDLSSTDSQAAGLPASYTFTTVDAGSHTFNNVILKTAGSQTITATDSVTSTITGSAAVNVTTLVVKATPTIAWPAPAAITYGTALSGTQLDATASSNGKAVPGTFTYGPALGSVLNAGLNQSLTVRFTPSDSTDYKSTTAMTKLNVLAAPLTVAVNPATKFYGQANPTFTVSYSGFVRGQGPSALAGALAFGTTAVPSSNVGNYAVQASGLSSQNYAISYEPGTLSVDPAVLTFTAVNKVSKFEAPNPRFTFTESGFVLGQSAKKVLTGTPVLSTTATENSPVGQYKIVVKQGTLHLLNKNYTFKFVNGLLQVIG